LLATVSEVIMPIVMEPRDNHRILRVRIADPWTTEDMDGLFAQMWPIFERSHRRVYWLVEMALARTIPSRFLIRLHQEAIMTQPNFGGAVFVNASPVMQALLDVATTIFHLEPVRFFRAEDEAWAYLRGLVACDDESTAAREVA
jgi:hypothetical protein